MRKSLPKRNFFLVFFSNCLYQWMWEVPGGMTLQSFYVLFKGFSNKNTLALSSLISSVKGYEGEVNSKDVSVYAKLCQVYDIDVTCEFGYKMIHLLIIFSSISQHVKCEKDDSVVDSFANERKWIRKSLVMCSNFFFFFIIFNTTNHPVSPNSPWNLWVTTATMVHPERRTQQSAKSAFTPVVRWVVHFRTRGNPTIGQADSRGYSLTP